MRILGFKDGYQGVLDNSVELLTWTHIDPTQGGTILRSLRYAPRTDEERQMILDRLRELEVDTFVAIGGDGSLAATKALNDYASTSRVPINILGFPRTIDNDIRTETLEGDTELALCPGYPSAALKTAKLTTALRTTAMSSKKIFVLETMGRDSGWLAAACALGGAELILLPEYNLTEDDWQRCSERVARFYRDQGHVIIGVSEGIFLEGEQIMDAAMGPRRLGGVGVDVAKKLKDYLEKILGRDSFGIRYQQAGYSPRMGRPSKYDLDLASALGQQIRSMLRDDRSGEFPVVSQLVDRSRLAEHLASRPLGQIEKSRFPTSTFYDSERFCLERPAIDFLQTITAEPVG